MREEMEALARRAVACFHCRGAECDHLVAAQHEASFPSPPVSHQRVRPAEGPGRRLGIGLERLAVLRRLVQHLGRPVTGSEVWVAWTAAGVQPTEHKDVGGCLSTLAGSGKVRRVEGRPTRWDVVRDAL